MRSGSRLRLALLIAASVVLYFSLAADPLSVPLPVELRTNSEPPNDNPTNPPSLQRDARTDTRQAATISQPSRPPQEEAANAHNSTEPVPNRSSSLLNLTACEELTSLPPNAARRLLHQLFTSYELLTGNLPYRPHEQRLIIQGIDSHPSPSSSLVSLCQENDVNRFGHVTQVLSRGSPLYSRWHSLHLNFRKIIELNRLADLDRLYLHIISDPTCNTIAALPTSMTRRILLSLFRRYHSITAYSPDISGVPHEMLIATATHHSNPSSILKDFCNVNNPRSFAFAIAELLIDSTTSSQVRASLHLDVTNLMPQLLWPYTSKPDIETSVYRANVRDLTTCAELLDWLYPVRFALETGIQYVTALRTSRHFVLDWPYHFGSAEYCLLASALHLDYFRMLASWALDAYRDRGSRLPLFSTEQVRCGSFLASEAYYQWEWRWVYMSTCSSSSARQRYTYISHATAEYMMLFLAWKLGEELSASFDAPSISFITDPLASFAGRARRHEGSIELNTEQSSAARINLQVLLHEAAHIFHYQAFRHDLTYDHDAEAHGSDFRWMQMLIYPLILPYLSVDVGCDLADEMGVSMREDVCG